MIRIKEINSKSEMKQFVKFPFELYKNNNYWVPPIIQEEIDGFDASKNPVFKQASAQYFLAYKQEKIVGRIAVIINHTEVNVQKIKKIRFGWFDVVDDIAVTKGLLNKVTEIAKKNNLEKMEGPIGFSNMDKVGVLTKGYDKIGKMVTWYNHSYYVKHFKELGFKIGKEYVETTILIKDINIEKYTKFADILKKRYGYKALNFTSSKEVMPYVEEMFKLFEKAYSKLETFVPISDEQVSFFKKKYISFINPEYIKFVVDKDGKLVSFAILMPSFAKALQKAKGKLFPFGLFHLLKAKKKNDTVVSYLIGIDPEYQSKGVTAIVFDEFYKTVVHNGIDKMVITPMLKNNEEIHKIWRNFKPVIDKERATFTKKIN